MGPFSPFPHLQQKLWAPERPSQHPKCSPCPGDTAPAPGATVWTGDTSPKPLSPQPPPRSAAPPAPCCPQGGHFCPISVSPPVSPKPCSSPSVTAASPRAVGGQAGAPRRFHQREPKCHQIRPATCAHHRGVGAPGHGWPHGDWHPFVGLCHQKKSPASCPSTMAGEKTHVLPPVCAWSIPKFPRWLLGFSQPKPPVRNQRLPPKHRVKGVIGLN